MNILCRPVRNPCLNLFLNITLWDVNLVPSIMTYFYFFFYFGTFQSSNIMALSNWEYTHGSQTIIYKVKYYSDLYQLHFLSLRNFQRKFLKVLRPCDITQLWTLDVPSGILYAALIFITMTTVKLSYFRYL